jgi:hypothetical protein
LVVEEPFLINVVVVGGIDHEAHVDEFGVGLIGDLIVLRLDELGLRELLLRGWLRTGLLQPLRWLQGCLLRLCVTHLFRVAPRQELLQRGYLVDVNVLQQGLEIILQCGLPLLYELRVRVAEHLLRREVGHTLLNVLYLCAQVQHVPIALIELPG